MNRRSVRGRAAVTVLLSMTAACGNASLDAGLGDPSVGPIGVERRVLRVSTVQTDGIADDIDRCVWVAETVDQRRKGLMNVTSLGAADGMLFVHDEPTSGSFWMKDTLLDLSIAYFDAEGVFLDATDMTPCTASNSADCRLYPTPSEYQFALEVVQGDLVDFGIRESSVVSLTDENCSASTMAE